MVDEGSESSIGDCHGVRARPPSVLFVNDLWGYGTVTMAMAVAHELGKKAICLFAGQGPGYELARRASFDDLIPIDTMADWILPELDEAIRESDVVVTVQNGRVAHWSSERGVPCVYLDCMPWMWTAAPKLPRDVAYFAERFPGADEQLDHWGQAEYSKEVVGPLVSQPTREHSSSAPAALINFGGLSCPLLDDPSLAAYADAMARCTLTALTGHPGRVIIAAGQHIQKLMDREALRSIHPRVELADLTHDAYMAELRRSRVLISSAGIHALYEASADGVPYVCLPAQNLSQVLALEVLEQRGVDRVLDWRHIYDLTGLHIADEKGACDRIAGCVKRFGTDVAAQDTLVQHLRAALDPHQLRSALLRQVSFFREQGDNGARYVADRVLRMAADSMLGTARPTAPLPAPAPSPMP